MHDDYLAEAGKHPGELPIVSLVKVTERRFANGTSFDPEFKIIGWTKRPQEFGPERDPNAKVAPRSAPKMMEDEIPF